MYSLSAPKISIITAALNAAHTLPSTLDSVLAQDYAHIEHIIIDGKSSNNTLDLIESYRHKYHTKGYELHVFSQKDRGIYDAMNKRLQLASGEIVGFLNADDFFAQNNVASLIAWGFAKPSNAIQIVYADVIYVDKNLKPIRDFRAKPYTKDAFRFGFHPPHPSFYVKKDVYQTYGGFNLKYKIASDYEIMLRFLEKHQLQSLYIQEYFVKMRIGSVSNANFKNIIRANLECFASFKDNNLARFPIFIALKPLSKLKSVRYKQIAKKLLGGAHKITFVASYKDALPSLEYTPFWHTAPKFSNLSNTSYSRTIAQTTFEARKQCA